MTLRANSLSISPLSCCHTFLYIPHSLILPLEINLLTVTNSKYWFFGISDSYQGLFKKKNGKLDNAFLEFLSASQLLDLSHKYYNNYTTLDKNKRNIPPKKYSTQWHAFFGYKLIMANLALRASYIILYLMHTYGKVVRARPGITAFGIEIGSL